MTPWTFFSHWQECASLVTDTSFCIQTPPQALNNNLIEGRKCFLLTEANSNSWPTAQRPSIDKWAVDWHHEHKDMIENWLFNAAAAATAPLKIGNHKSAFQNVKSWDHSSTPGAKCFLFRDGKSRLFLARKIKTEGKNMCFQIHLHERWRDHRQLEQIYENMGIRICSNQKNLQQRCERNSSDCLKWGCMRFLIHTQFTVDDSQLTRRLENYRGVPAQSNELLWTGSATKCVFTSL